MRTDKTSRRGAEAKPAHTSATNAAPVGLRGQGPANPASPIDGARCSSNSAHNGIDQRPGIYSPNSKPGELLEEALIKCGMPRIRVHDLRHVFASYFVMSGGDIFTLQRILGHSTPQITSDTYAHLSPAHLAGAADRVSFPAPAEPAKVIPFQPSDTGAATGM